MERYIRGSLTLNEKPNAEWYWAFFYYFSINKYVMIIYHENTKKSLLWLTLSGYQEITKQALLPHFNHYHITDRCIDRIYTSMAIYKGISNNNWFYKSDMNIWSIKKNSEIWIFSPIDYMEYYEPFYHDYYYTPDHEFLFRLDRVTYQIDDKDNLPDYVIESLFFEIEKSDGIHKNS